MDAEPSSPPVDKNQVNRKRRGIERSVSPCAFMERICVRCVVASADRAARAEDKSAAEVSLPDQFVKLIMAILPPIAVLTVVSLRKPAWRPESHTHRVPPAWNPEETQDLVLKTIMTDLRRPRPCAAIISHLLGAAHEIARTMTPQEVFYGVAMDPVTLLHSLSTRFAPLDEERRLRTANELPWSPVTQGRTSTFQIPFRHRTCPNPRRWTQCASSHYYFCCFVHAASISYNFSLDGTLQQPLAVNGDRAQHVDYAHALTWTCYDASSRQHYLHAHSHGTDLATSRRRLCWTRATSSHKARPHPCLAAVCCEHRR